MVNMASGMARGRVLPPTTTTAVVSHQYGDISHASLLNIRSHKAPFTQVIFVAQLDAIFVVLGVTSSFKHDQNLGDIAATKSQVVYTRDFRA